MLSAVAVGNIALPRRGGDLSILGFLERNALFAGLPEGLRRTIAEDMTMVEVAAGETIFGKGDVGEAVYFVVSGRVLLESSGVVLTARGPGECLGEFALIDQAPRSASAVADCASRLVRWTSAAFRRSLNEHPVIATGLFRLLTAKLREDVVTQVDYALEQQRWRLELEWAREVQLGLLPPADAHIGEMRVAAHCAPARDVGGDFYDYLSGPHGTAVLIGDVTGHGFYSALLAAMAKSCFHTQAGFDASPSAVVSALRGTLALSIGRRMLMSCCYVLIDAGCHLRYANAGHPPMLLAAAAADAVERLGALDPILGVLGSEAAPAGECSRSLASGDTLLLYTDGVIEARDREGQAFGIDRLADLLSRERHADPSAIRRAVIETVREHLAGRDVGDDLTLVVVRVG